MRPTVVVTVTPGGDVGVLLGWSRDTKVSVPEGDTRRSEEKVQKHVEERIRVMRGRTGCITGPGSPLWNEQNTQHVRIRNKSGRTDERRPTWEPKTMRDEGPLVKTTYGCFRPEPQDWGQNGSDPF